MAGALVAVRGSADVGSAVAHRLFTAGLQVVIHDDPAPAAARRGMAFADAAFDGTARLEGVAAERVDELALLDRILCLHRSIPLVVCDLGALLYVGEPQVLIDARMRKHGVPEPQIGLAPLTIGLGPNFVAGHTTHWVVETQWGDGLGTVLCEGRAADLSGEPRSFLGQSRSRFVYAPFEGLFTTPRQIADPVETGEVVGFLEGQALTAPMAGILRGLVRSGVMVKAGAKVIEVDPRADRSMVFGIGERPGRIADGILDALREWMTQSP